MLSWAYFISGVYRKCEGDEHYGYPSRNNNAYRQAT